MKCLYAVIAVTTMGLTQCANPSEQIKSIKIEDLSKEHRVVVRSEKPTPNNIRLYITGISDGTYIVHGEKFSAGRIDTSLLFDCYSDTVLIRYAPITAKTGELEIRYSY